MTSDLITRLSKLDAPDREVDAEIYIRFNIPAERAGRIDYSNGMVGWWPKDGPYVSAVTVPAYTASVDAAIALAERVFPGWGWELASNTSHIKNCLNPEYGNPVGKHPHWAAVANQSSRKFVDGATPAIALLIALLRAKEASKL